MSEVLTDVVAAAIVFTDIVGFTSFTQTSGDAAALAVVEQMEGLLQTTVAERGRVVKGLGDGHLLAFPDAATAVRSAVELQTVFARARLGGDEPLWVRIGVHWGRPTVRGADLLGHDVNVASRVTDQAGPGEVLVSDDARHAVGHALDGSVRFLEIGPASMKGLREPIWLHRAIPA